MDGLFSLIFVELDSYLPPQLFLTHLQADGSLLVSQWITNIEFEWVSNRSLKSWVIMPYFSQIDVKDGFAVGTRSCPQHAQHPTFCEVWACIRLYKIYFGDAWIGIWFLRQFIAPVEDIPFYLMFILSSKTPGQMWCNEPIGVCN